MSKANVHHEFKSPINRIKGLAKILCSDDSLSQAERESLLAQIEINAERVTRSAERLLLHASWDGVHINTDTVSSSDLITHFDQVIETHRAKGLVQVVFRHDLPEQSSYKLDVHLTTQALENLLENTGKFTEQGSALVTLSASQNQLILSCADDGPGMHDVSKAAIPYWQESTGLDRTAEGLGLGLAICEKIAHAHGGSLELSSAPGSGLTARILLPSTN